jgi:glycosyltransferase involved in cell wall biosynthesis
MHVLVLFTYNYSLTTWNDSGTFYKEIESYERLSKKNINFTFLTFSENEPHLDYLKKHKIKVLPIYKYMKKSKFKIINYLKSFFIPFYLKDKLGEVDVIKQNQLLGSWIAITFKIILKKPLFIRTGYDMYEFSIKENKNRFTQFLYKLLTSVSLKFADFYTASSLSDINFLEKNFNIKKNFIQHRPNWVREINSTEFNERIPNKIIVIGRLEVQKNLSYLIQSFSNSNYEIDLVGEGSLYNELSETALENNVKVNFLGKLENENILNLLKTYKYYISSSTFEGNPKSTLEALSAGCIVFLSDISNHKELVRHGKNGFIFKLTESDFINFFENIINDFDLNKISDSAQKQVLENNSIEKMVNLEFNDLNKLKI